MGKYKICEFEDGHGRKKYRIKCKVVLGIWCYHREYKRFSDDGTIVEKDSFEDARDIVESLKEYDKSRERKLKSCVKIL